MRSNILLKSSKRTAELQPTQPPYPAFPPTDPSSLHARIHIQVTMKELEDHKSLAHPNVWCMHFEFSGDQRELYKHLVFLPGQRSVSPTAIAMKTRQQTIANAPPEKICTKCTKNCTTLAELHRHMLECGGDQAWLLGLFGNGKKKCKWRPFGSRSRRRRQRGMKRNIQNSQTPRNNPPRERPAPSGPRVRPSDRKCQSIFFLFLFCFYASLVEEKLLEVVRRQW